jgi:hypothetical protein
MKVVSQGQCGFLPLPDAKLKVIHEELLPAGPREAVQKLILQGMALQF